MATATLENTGNTTAKKQRVLISCDSHGGMPDDELRSRLPENLRDKLPDLAKLREAGSPQDKRTQMVNKTEVQLYPEDRLREQAIDGVHAEVLFGGVATGDVKDLKMSVAKAQATNNWFHEAYQGYFNRFAPSAALPLPVGVYGTQGTTAPAPPPEFIEAAANEIRRVAKLGGLRPCMLPDHCDALPYNNPAWEPVWQAAEECDMPLAFHVGMGRNPVRHRNPGGALVNYTLVAMSISETVALLACSGVLENHPELRTVMVECGGSWLAGAMQFMDEAHEKHHFWAKPQLKELPSFYVKRQVGVTFQEDPVAIANREFTGTDCLLWGSDYPHLEGTWPNSQEAVAKQFKGVPEDHIDKIVRRNAERLFGFDLSDVAAA